jgi:CDK-activating kinase assembly factor MAT1
MILISAFNLLNDIDVPKTEARIAQFQKQNAESITANKHSALLESLGQHERDELEKRAREERMEMVANAEELDRVEEERAKGLIGEALVRPSPVNLWKLAHTFRCEEINCKPRRSASVRIVKRKLEPKH